MSPKSMKGMTFVGVAALALLTTACGDFSRSSRSPSQVYIQSMEGASAATPGLVGGSMLSDVISYSPEPCAPTAPCIFSDFGQVTMVLVLKDLGQPGLFAQPTPLNNVTFTRYRVVYKRTDGRNSPGVDVPYAWDGATTFTVPETGSVKSTFEVVRSIAKSEAPLAALVFNRNAISTIAEITFYGHDQAGNAVSTMGSMGIEFGNFADPE